MSTVIKIVVDSPASDSVSSIEIGSPDKTLQSPNNVKTSTNYGKDEEHQGKEGGEIQPRASTPKKELENLLKKKQESGEELSETDNNSNKTTPKNKG